MCGSGNTSMKLEALRARTSVRAFARGTPSTWSDPDDFRLNSRPSLSDSPSGILRWTAIIGTDKPLTTARSVTQRSCSLFPRPNMTVPMTAMLASGPSEV